uniref:Odorant receptor n=1 Tax=Planotortrix octo TaxID=65038 RepID=A0A0B5GI86_9NEOP|nr:olfactory receptor OR37 [Planotortrix octo]
MEHLNNLKESMAVTKARLKENSLDSLVWLGNIVPRILGFDSAREKVFIPYWILHFSLFTYVYVVGCVVYQARHAKVASDFVKNYVNVSLVILTVMNSYWFLVERGLLKTVLKKVKEIDNYVVQSGLFAEKHTHSLFLIKRIIHIFGGLNLISFFVVNIPNRLDLKIETFSMAICVGIEPLTSSPNREICKVLLGMTECSLGAVTLHFQTLMLILIAHTTSMYQILSDDIMMFNTELEDHRDYAYIKDKLSMMVYRHALILEITQGLKSLYSMPMGVNFGLNAVCMCFFCFLTSDEYLGFMPILVYSFLAFFLYCLLGQRLTNAAEVFARAVYSCGWEKMNVKEQKAIYIMLMQAQKPVELLAADIIPVNMYTFASTIEAIYKFTTAVKL